MAIAFDAFASLCTAYTGATGVMTLSNFTVGAGADRVVYVAVYVNASGGSMTGFGVTATFGGVNMDTVFSSSGTAGGLVLFRLIAPTTGSNTVAATISGSGKGSYRVASHGISFSGVNQTTPEPNTGNQGTESATNTSSYPTTFNMPVSGGVFGFQFGWILYSLTVDGPPTNESPFTTRDANGTALIKSGGLPAAGQYAYMSHLAYSGASTNVTWLANLTLSNTYTYIAGVMPLNATPVTTTVSVDTVAYGLTVEDQSNEVIAPADAAIYGFTPGAVLAQLSVPVSPAIYSLTGEPVNQVSPALYALTFPDVSIHFPVDPHRVQLGPIAYAPNNQSVLRRRRRFGFF